MKDGQDSNIYHPRMLWRSKDVSNNAIATHVFCHVSLHQQHQLISNTQFSFELYKASGTRTICHPIRALDVDNEYLKEPIIPNPWHFLAPLLVFTFPIHVSKRQWPLQRLQPFENKVLFVRWLGYSSSTVSFFWKSDWRTYIRVSVLKVKVNVCVDALQVGVVLVFPSSCTIYKYACIFVGVLTTTPKPRQCS